MVTQVGTAAGTAALPKRSPIHYNEPFMPLFRIHRMKDAPRQQFRLAPHVSGVAVVKPKDYEMAGEVEAENEYAAWAVLRGSEAPLQVGDLLETPLGMMRICKFVGFDEAKWLVVEQPAATMVTAMPPMQAPPFHSPA